MLRLRTPLRWGHRSGVRFSFLERDSLTVASGIDRVLQRGTLVSRLELGGDQGSDGSEEENQDRTVGPRRGTTTRA